MVYECGGMALRFPRTLVMLAVFVASMNAAAAAEPPGDACSRPPMGAVIAGPPELRSSHGALVVDLSLRNFTDVYGAKTYCYVDQNGQQAPTLRVRPGDELVVHLKNRLEGEPGAMPMHVHGASPQACGTAPMNALTTNLHFHGMGLPPTCHQDETLRTAVNPSDPAFEYRLKIPLDAPPGLYWYHPHPHGYTEQQVLGGASGALIVEGIEKDSPVVSGLPERVMVLRDQKIPGMTENDEDSGPGKDISLNFVPVMYPLYRPAELPVRPGEREFWRVLNASADTYFVIQLRFGSTIQEIGDPQALELIGVDGVPTRPAASATEILLAPGARAEFVVTTPAEGTFAQLVTLKYDTGPDGAASPYRVIANVRSRADAPAAPSAMPPGAGATKNAATAVLKPVQSRKLYFSEDRADLKDPRQRAKYFITVEGQTPRVFDMNFTKPDVTAVQGTLEDWTIENRTKEAHAFHIHQIHFQVIERDGKPVDDGTWRDTIDLPFWDGNSVSYPSVKLRMDFRSPETVGTFVFHCHILEHEDGGMMGSIQVLPHARNQKGNGRFAGGAAGAVVK